jgi:carbonic anhydrase
VSLTSLTHEERRQKLVSAQTPFAIVLSCSDSRAPSEILFDQGLGDLFVIRVAGNIVAPSIIGSIEFAAATFGTQLVVVMGHSHCGAVSAALNVEQHDHDIESENIRDIVERITPAIRPVIATHESIENKLISRDKLLDQCIKSNILASVNHLKHGSKVIENLIQQKKLAVVSAHYCIESGKVSFFDESKTSSVNLSEKLTERIKNIQQ